MDVAEMILKQLGGRRFIVMTGAKNLLGSDNSLSFQLPGGGGYCRNGINRVLVELTPADDYTITFYRVRTNKISFQEAISGVYCYNLREVFEAHTGLATSL